MKEYFFYKINVFSLDQLIFSLYIIDKRTTRFKEDRQLEPSTP